MNTIGQKIKGLRLNKKLSQGGLGKLVGLSHSQIGWYERDQSNPDASMMEKLGKALGVPATYFLEKEPSNPEEQDNKIMKGRLERTLEELQKVKARLEKSEKENMSLMRKLLGFKDEE